MCYLSYIEWHFRDSTKANDPSIQVTQYSSYIMNNMTPCQSRATYELRWMFEYHTHNHIQSNIWLESFCSIHLKLEPSPANHQRQQMQHIGNGSSAAHMKIDKYWYMLPYQTHGWRSTARSVRIDYHHVNSAMRLTYQTHESIKMPKLNSPEDIVNTLDIAHIVNIVEL